MQQRDWGHVDRTHKVTAEKPRVKEGGGGDQAIHNILGASDFPASDLWSSSLRPLCSIPDISLPLSLSLTSFQTLCSLSRTGKNVLENITYPEQAILFPLPFVTSNHDHFCMSVIFYVCSNYSFDHCTLPLLPLPSTIPTLPHITYFSSTTLDNGDNQLPLNI